MLFSFPPTMHKGSDFYTSLTTLVTFFCWWCFVFICFDNSYASEYDVVPTFLNKMTSAHGSVPETLI